MLKLKKVKEVVPMNEQKNIILQHVKENNLKDVSLQIPKQTLTVFTGVSGSGKSSIVFDTISKEAQRQLNQTFSAYIQNRLPKHSHPDAQTIKNLSPAVVIDQKRLGGGSRSTLGTVTDIYTLLRLLFSRIGEPFIGESEIFSFNNPEGMCPDCHGIGYQVEPYVDKFFDMTKSLSEGAILFSTFSLGTWYSNKHLMSGIFNTDKKLMNYTDEEWQTLLYGTNQKIPLPIENEPFKYFEGVIDRFKRMHLKSNINISHLSKNIEKYISLTHCSTCHGSRLSQKVLKCKINGGNIAQFSNMEILELIAVINNIHDPIAKSIVAELSDRLQNLIDIGLYYLTLNRETSSLSGGESQRIKMVRNLNSSLIDMIYIFDEPSIGLHPHEVSKLNHMLQKIRDKGNTVIVVEHDRDVIGIADYIIDVGPGAGTNGGEIVYEGDLDGLYKSDTLTGKYMKIAQPIKKLTRNPKYKLTIGKASKHNLKNITVQIPCNILTAVTGFSGSGKSTLILDEFVTRYPEAIIIDQKAVGTSIRSNPATYTGIMDSIRGLFAGINQVSKSLFSFNSKGACPKCKGTGVIYTDMAFLDTIKTTCDVCHGNRFKEEVLKYKIDNKSIADILDMTVLEALAFFNESEIHKSLQSLSDVGLNYLTLGQPLSTLSGGECQRIKLAKELHKKGNIYILDEPTTGLHMSDIDKLLKILNNLVDHGSTVVVIEHNTDIIRQADWIIELGPEGGRNGGKVIFEGKPMDSNYR